MERNVTRYALLGLLTLRPGGASGYDLRRLAENSIGYFWNESYGQIYPALKQLKKQGLVAARAAAAGKRDRIVYELTAAGRKALAGWLQAGARAQPPRNELLLKLFFGPEAAPETSARHIREVQARHRELLARYDAVEREITGKHGDEAGLPYWLMTLDFGRRHSRMVLDWSEHTLRKLDNLGATERRKASDVPRRR